MITYQSENPFDVKEDLLPLHEVHYEADHRKSETPLDIDWDSYKVGYEEGVIELITSRDDGVVVGYMSALISEHHHNKGYNVGNMDTLFVSEPYRNKGVATELVGSMEEHLKEAGVDWFSAGFREESTASGVLGNRGYSKIECTFGKSLRGEL